MPEMSQQDRAQSVPPNLRNMAKFWALVFFVALIVLIVVAQFVDIGPYERWIKIGSYVVGILFGVFAVGIVALRKRYTDKPK